MKRWWRGRRDAGETPVAVMVGLVVFSVLVLSAGPAIIAFTSQAAVTSGDREVDKALAVHAGAARNLPWDVLADAAGRGPVTEQVELAGNPVQVTTFVEPDPDAPATRVVVTKAIAAEGTGASCVAASVADLPRACVTRSVVVTAPATDARPEQGSGVQVSAALASDDGAGLSAGQDLFSVRVDAPTLVSVVARAEPLEVDLVAGGVSRARMRLDRPVGQDGGWVVGNAVVCPSWVPSRPAAVELAARLRTPGTVHAAQVLVLTTPAAAGSCPS